MRNVLLLVAVVAVAPAAPVPKKLKKQTDEELLTGVWEIVTLDEGKGQQPPPAVLVNFHFRYSDGILSTGTPTSPGWENVKSSLDSAADPKVMTLETAPGKLIKNIYKIEGDTLYWCEWQKTDAPDSFDGGNEKNSFVLKRVSGK